jgi:translation initiation factor IF-2
VPVSAKTGDGLDNLVESLALQAELLELKANPERHAEGTIIEAKLEQGRGSVATVLVQRGTLRVGDIFVAGCEYGRVRALLNERGERVEEAGPSVPVEVLGLNGTPEAGDDFIVVEDDSRARDVADFRAEKKKQAHLAASGRGTLEQMLSRIKEGVAQSVPVVIKSDVHGSLEAIVGALDKLGTSEVEVNVLHSGVGGINESDVTLARASDAVVLAFNVRANAQARDLARRDGVEIRYYSIIYNVIDDIKALMSGLLSPEQNEKFLGYAEIREVFSVSKSGKVAGCMITEGQVKRGAKVRLLRDDVVIHDGVLKTLRRFKDEVREVQQGYECGMAFEGYQDIQVGDRIECYEIEEVARSL